MRLSTTVRTPSRCRVRKSESVSVWTTKVSSSAEALDGLARQELRLFTRGVSGNVEEGRAAELALAGVRIVEQFILLVRRKRLLQALHELRSEQWKDSTGTDD